MATLRIKNLKNVQSSVRKAIIKGLRSPDIREGIGKIVVDGIQANKIPVKSEATKAWRKYLEQGNTTSPKYSRPFINITFTGALLKDLLSNVRLKISRSSAIFVLEHTDKKHKKMRKPSGKLLKGEAKSFNYISDQLENRLGYKYLTFSSGTKEKVLAFIKKKLFSNISKKL